MIMKGIGYGLFLIVAVVFCACRPTKPESQGIRGQVYWVEGNLMPQVGEDGSVSQERDQKSKVARRLVIHALTTLDQLHVGDYLIGSIGTELITEVKTEADGSFEIELPIGRYSVFTVEEEGFFANVFDRDNHVNPVEVKKGEWSFLEIIINYRAVY